MRRIQESEFRRQIQPIKERVGLPKYYILNSEFWILTPEFLSHPNKI